MLTLLLFLYPTVEWKADMISGVIVTTLLGVKEGRSCAIECYNIITQIHLQHHPGTGNVHRVTLSLPFVWKLGVEANITPFSGAFRLEETKHPLFLQI